MEKIKVTPQDCDNLFSLLIQFVGEDARRGELGTSAIVINDEALLDKLGALEFQGMKLTGEQILQDFTRLCSDVYEIEADANQRIHRIFPR